VMIGDSVENDVVGAAEAGCKTCLVRGTAFREELLRSASRKPDAIVDSVDDLNP